MFNGHTNAEFSGYNSAIEKTKDSLMFIMQAIQIQICLLDKNIRCDQSQGYIQDLSLGWVNVLARMNVHPKAQA